MTGVMGYVIFGSDFAIQVFNNAVVILRVLDCYVLCGIYHLIGD